MNAFCGQFVYKDENWPTADKPKLRSQQWMAPTILASYIYDN
jgi:hypothetical protein